MTTENIPTKEKCAEPCVGVSVDCTTCGLRKKPVGRSAPLEMANSLCDSDCDGYYCAPMVGQLWPGETCVEFGYLHPEPVAPLRTWVSDLSEPVASSVQKCAYVYPGRSGPLEREGQVCGWPADDPIHSLDTAYGHDYAVTPPSERGPHDWTHPAEDCDVDACDHITRRTCEGAEKVIKFLMETLRKRTALLCKADPEWARRATENVLRAVFADDEPTDEAARERRERS